MYNANILAIDLETKANEKWLDYNKAALDFNRLDVSIYAVSSAQSGAVHRDVRDLSVYQERDFVTHNGKFDFKALLSRPGTPIKREQYKHDTMLMAVALSEKIPQSYLDWYESQRVAINKQLGKRVHREAGQYSLKTLAPYFLGIDPFWEVENRDNEEYALKDARYTAMLGDVLYQELTRLGQVDFYEKVLMPWSHMLLRAEMNGVKIDMDMLDPISKEHEAKALELSTKLKQTWGEYIDPIEERAKQEIIADYQAKKQAAINKLAPSKKKDPTKAAGEDMEKRANVEVRYNAMKDAALAKVKDFNFASPSQLNELFKSMGLDISKFNSEDESTGKAVLERLASEGVAGVYDFLAYRKSHKLATAFFPSYRRMQVNSVIHTNFNLTGTRTGRLSSNNPNLQQSPRSNLDLFIARPGKLLVYRDASAIEPRLIAYLTECFELCDIFLQGSDFHSFNVRTMLGIDEDDKTIKTKYAAERDMVKEIGLSLMYGASWKRIFESSAKRGMPLTQRECKAAYKSFQEKYADVWEYKARLEERIKKGEIIENILGRPLSFEEDRIHMQSLNTLIQSSGSDILLESTRMLCDAEPLAEPLLFIHDAGVLEAPAADAKRIYDQYGEVLLSWDLPTRYGSIPLKSEGYIADRLGGKAT